MLEPGEIRYIRRNLLKARKENTAIRNALDHIDLLLDHIAHLEAERGVNCSQLPTGSGGMSVNHDNTRVNI